MVFRWDAICRLSPSLFVQIHFLLNAVAWCLLVQWTHTVRSLRGLSSTYLDRREAGLGECHNLITGTWKPWWIWWVWGDQLQDFSEAHPMIPPFFLPGECQCMVFWDCALDQPNALVWKLQWSAHLAEAAWGLGDSERQPRGLYYIRWGWWNRAWKY